ncbi:hypothetical protein [Deinococcus apachensis]|uniref:hypothetical protein n=1 Tax=Deinococcus apachensis TaxID=309886 RepID=UPI001B7FB448|nr:hypothetical protein [Deinococcus apachensis]
MGRILALAGLPLTPTVTARGTVLDASDAQLEQDCTVARPDVLVLTLPAGARLPLDLHQETP